MLNNLEFVAVEMTDSNGESGNREVHYSTLEWSRAELDAVRSELNAPGHQALHGRGLPRCDKPAEPFADRIVEALTGEPAELDQAREENPAVPAAQLAHRGPASAPDPAMPPVPAHWGWRSLSSGFSGWLQALFWLAAAVALAAGVVALAALVTFNDFMDTRAGSRAERDALQRWVDLDDAHVTMTQLAQLAWMAVVVVLIVWMYKAHKITQQLWHGERSWSAGWTIGGWFIPAAQFVIPKLVLGEIERLAKAPRKNGRTEEGWRRIPTSAVGWVWWVFSLAGIVSVIIGVTLLNDEGANPSDIRRGYGFSVAGFACWAMSAVLGATHVREVGKLLSFSALRGDRY